MSIEAETQRRARQAALRLERAAHPDIVALRVERWRVIITTFIWTGLGIGIAFTVQNVQRFAAQVGGYEQYSTGWWAAWLIEPAVCLVLVAVLMTERLTSPEQIWLAGRTWVCKIALIAATYGMNTWSYWSAGDVAGIFLHSVPVVVVLAASEVITDCNDKLTTLLHKKFAVAEAKKETTRQAKQTAAATEGPGTAPAGGQPFRTVQPSVSPAGATPTEATGAAGPPAAPALRAVPNWSAVSGATTPTSDTTAQRGPDRSAPTHRTETGPKSRPEHRTAERTDTSDRSEPTEQTGQTDRSEPRIRTGPARNSTSSPTRSGPGGSTRKATGKAGRSDADLAEAIRALAESTGSTPSQYQLKQSLGIGTGRAQRLLAEFTTTGSPDRPHTNGTGPTRQEGSR